MNELEELQKQTLVKKPSTPSITAKSSKLSISSSGHIHKKSEKDKENNEDRTPIRLPIKIKSPMNLMALITKEKLAATHGMSGNQETQMTVNHNYLEETNTDSKEDVIEEPAPFTVSQFPFPWPIKD